MRLAVVVDLDGHVEESVVTGKAKPRGEILRAGVVATVPRDGLRRVEDTGLDAVGLPVRKIAVHLDRRLRPRHALRFGGDGHEGHGVLGLDDERALERLRLLDVVGDCRHADQRRNRAANECYFHLFHGRSPRV